MLPVLARALIVLIVGASSAHAQVCADPTRTLQTSGSAACHVYDGDAARCAQAWAVTQNGGQAVSCFYVASQASCQGCGPGNEAAGACRNTCAAALVAVPALPAGAPWLLAASLLGLGALARTGRRRGA